MDLNRFTHYILGNESMDREHKSIYNALIDLWSDDPPSKYPEKIQKTLDVCNQHFVHEHQMMIEHNYPFLESHQVVHKVTEQKFFDVITHPTKENLEELIDDLLYHIDWFDRQFVAWINGEHRRRKDDPKYQ